ncbi:MAG: hypothetical protein IT353_16840 [Gemmatimonadaceae bacterium]|nr:hypothetical protein [Gemmatimonadaceae bacterium]
MPHTPSSKLTEQPRQSHTALEVFAVVHTHWDREWYHSQSRFQARLVALIDAVLAAPADPSTPVLLDGQAIALRDYLAIRPERQVHVAQAIASGAIEAGPWYVLGDNQLPCGEALVRNLEAGRRWLTRWGGAAPRVAYCPDTFGHPGALPLIATQFGCTTAVVWRGFGGRSFPVADTAWWGSADGSRVLLYHLAPDGYELGSALPTHESAAEERWTALERVLRARNHTGAVVLPVGADHHAPSPDVASAIDALHAAALKTGAAVQRAGLGRALGAIRLAALALDATGAPLPSVQGALRDSYGYTWTLQGTFATRAARKRTNARRERQLLHDAEPWGALAWLHAPPACHAVSPDGAISIAQLPALTHHAWEILLSTHPHDTLCGCSIDVVDAEMAVRQRQVQDVATEIRDAALSMALSHDGVLARSREVVAAPSVVVRNGVSYARAGIAELTIDETLSHVRVGPNSAGLTDASAETGFTDVRVPTVGSLVVQACGSHERFLRRESPQHYPDNDRVRRHRLLAWVPPVPAFGLRVLGAHSDAATMAPPPVVLAEPRPGTITINNGLLAVVVDQSGVTVRCGERVLHNVLTVCTTSDLGDSYTPSLRGDTEELRLARVRVGYRGPLRASVVIGWVWKRNRERVSVQTEISLDAGADWLGCDVRGINARRDHCLQLHWHTDVRPLASSRRVHQADAAFGVLEPQLFRALDSDRPYEKPPSTFPLHRWASISDADRSATMISDGLAEGEIDAARIGVTLLRAIGELSRDDLPERPGHAGWPCPIPQAQCQGPFAARLALALHGPFDDAVRRRVEEIADAVLIPLRGTTWRDLESADVARAGPALVGQGLRASSVHLCDTGNALRLRAFNTTARDVEGAWHLPEGAWESRCCRMDGTPLGAWQATSSVIAFQAAAHATVTHEVRRAGGA